MTAATEPQPTTDPIGDLQRAKIRAEMAGEIAQAIEAADTSGWPGDRQGDVDGCQERAARIARNHR